MGRAGAKLMGAQLCTGQVFYSELHMYELELIKMYDHFLRCLVFTTLKLSGQSLASVGVQFPMDTKNC